MPVTDFRDIVLIDIGSLAKETLSNDGMNNLAVGISGTTQLALTGVTTALLLTDTADLSLYMTMVLTGVLDTDVTLVMPKRSRVNIFDNRTTGPYTVQVQTADQSGGVTVAQGARTLTVCDSVQVALVSGGGGGGTTLPVATATANFEWTTQTSGAPASGHLGIDTAGYTSVSTLRMTKSGDDGVDLTALLSRLQPEDDLYIQDRASSATFLRVRITGAGADQGTWMQFPVVWMNNAGETFPNNHDVLVVFSYAVAFPLASTTQPGLVALADNPTTIAGLNGTLAVTPAGLQARWATLPPLPGQATTSVAGIAPLATTTEGITGTNNTKIVTPAVMQAKMNAIPLASESVVGLAERATSQESIAGTDVTRFVTPAGLQAKINTLPVAPITGPPFSVVRIPANGTGQQASPITVDASGAVVATATNTQPVWTWQAEHTSTTGGLLLEAYQPGSGSPSLGFRKAKGTIAAPTRETSALGGSGNIYGQIYARAADNLSDTWIGLGSLQFMTESMDAQGRAGGYFRVNTAPGVSAPPAEVARLTGLGGNLLLGTTLTGTGLAKGVVIGLGTAPTTSPADAVQLWTADRAGVAAKASLHLRVESGTHHVFGDLVGIGTVTPTVALDVVGAIRASDVAGTLSHLGLGTTDDVQFGRLGLGRVASAAARLVFTGDTGQKILLYGDAASARNGLGLTSGVMQVFAQSTARIDLGAMSTSDGTTFTPHMTIHGGTGSIGVGATTWGTANIRVLSWAIGTAPTASWPADVAQLWVADRAGVAGRASWHLRAEDGTHHVIGDLVGIGTLTPSTAFEVAGGSRLQSLGIGVVPSPQAPLVFSNTVAHKIYLYDASLVRYGLGIGSGTLQVFAPNPGGRVDIVGLDTADGLTTSIARFSVHGGTANVAIGQSSSSSAQIGANVLSWRAGIAPTLTQTDVVQLWSEDYDGIAGQASLVIRNESGRLTKLGYGLITWLAVTSTSTTSVTTPLVLTEGDSNKVLVQSNGTEMGQFTLPDAAAGLTFTFVIYAAGGIRIRAAAGDIFRFGGTIGSAAGALQSTTLHGAITLVAVNASSWMATSVIGIWALVA